jgi:hypothetical protein
MLPCGAVERLLLPCRHVIANRVVHHRRFLRVQIVDRWFRHYMLNANHQPTDPVVHSWRSTDFARVDLADSFHDAPDTSVGLPVDTNYNLESRIDAFLARVREAALISVAVFSQLTALVQPGIHRIQLLNPRLAISQARDPVVVYGAGASDTRILSSGEDVSSPAQRAQSTQMILLS